MDVLTDIPFDLNAKPLATKVGLEEDSEEAEDFRRMLAAARAVGRPKAVCKLAFIEARGEDTVTCGGATFRSRVLRANLDKAGRVFAFVATCGAELDRIELPAGDVFSQFWLDCIKAAVLGFAVKHLHEHLSRKYALGKTAVMSPGSGDAGVWPIEEQKVLFALLGNVEELIGVRLTESSLMIPNKTVSGIRFPTDTDYDGCKVCHRPKCPSRRAPFDAEMARALGHVLDDGSP